MKTYKYEQSTDNLAGGFYLMETGQEFRLLGTCSDDAEGALIILAANSHDDLLSALKNVPFPQEGEDAQSFIFRLGVWFIQTRNKAIAKAEGDI